MPANLSGVTWSDYVRETIGADQQVDAARKTGLDQTTISRWVRGGQAGRAENVAKLARGYRRPVAEAFIAAGFMTIYDARVEVTIQSPADLSDDDLVDLLRDRLRARQEREPRGNTTPTSVTGGPASILRAYDVQVAQDAEGGVDAPSGTPDEIGHRRRSLKADRIAADEVPNAARTDEQGD